MQQAFCSTCVASYVGIMCPYCAIREGAQYVGQSADATDMPTDAASSSSGADAASNVPAMYQTSSSGTANVLPASWDDWMLLYPGLWIPYAASKILNPSQETDPTVRRTQLGGIAAALQNVRKTCTALPVTDQNNWDTFAKSFIPWFAKDPSIWDASLDKPQADLIQDQLRGWQIEFAKYCNIGMPILPKASPNLLSLGSEALQDIGSYIDTVKWIVVVGAGLFLISVAIIGVDNTRKIVTKAAL